MFSDRKVSISLFEILSISSGDTLRLRNVNNSFLFVLAPPSFA